MKHFNFLIKVMLGVTAIAFSNASIAASEHEVSGNISVLSSYDLRGMTNAPENDDATVQAGLEYGHESGFYAGYWFSTLGYNAANDPDGSNSFENNLYAGYSHSLNDDLSIDVGATYYYYYDGEDSNTPESLVALDYKGFNLSARTLLDDVTWGNSGDTYLLATYSYPLPKDFTLNTALGAYYYDDNDKYVAETTEDFNFRHFNVGVSHPLGDTGASMGLDYIIGGHDRVDEKQKNKVVASISYDF